MVEKFLEGIEKPGRYVGCEINACCKNFDEADVRFALAFPDVYEVGLSHLGLKLLYHGLNRMEGVMADRVYTPWPDFEKKLRALGEPLRAIESDRPLHRFDMVGFSLQYELSYTNILTMLDLAGIPLEAGERGPEHPWIIAGGPCAFNPEPLAELFDFIVLGEAEEVMAELVRAFRQWRGSGGSRREFLEAIRTIEGVYVPSFFDVSYEETGVVARVQPFFDDYTRVKKRLVLDLDEASPIPAAPLAPLLDIVHNRLSIEIARGCTRGCRFCQAGFIYRPVRERRPEAIFQAAEAALANSGFEELSLLSLSTGDYCQVQALLAALVDRFASDRVAVAFPSMRVGTLTPELMELVRRVRKTGFTLAPEAGSERLRRVINKGILDEDLLATVENAFHLGWRVLKLYFMTGFPTENEADLDALAELCQKVWKLARPTKSSINVSISTFVPKSMTPFQWVGQVRMDVVEERVKSLRGRFKRPGLRLKWSQSGQSLLEAVFARGDRRLGKVVRRAWELGARFDGWTELFREELWMRAFRDTGLDPHFYAGRERPREEIFPWDHLSAGVEKDFLWEEYQRALAGEYTPDCRTGRCTACGVCDHREIEPRLVTEAEGLMAAPVPDKSSEPESRGADGQYLYWLRYSKLGKMRFFGQLELAQCFGRAIRRTGLPAAYSKGFHPHVKLSFEGALPLGMESRIEQFYLTLTEMADPLDVRDRLNRYLPEGLHIEKVSPVARRIASPRELKATYVVSHLIPEDVRSIIANWPHLLHESLLKKTRSGEVAATLREVLLDVRLLDESSLELDLFEAPQKCFRPAAVLRKLLGEQCDSLSGCRICKVAHG